MELLAARHDFIVGRIPDDLNPRLFNLVEIGFEEVCLIVREGHPLLDKASAIAHDLPGYDWVFQPPGTLLRRAVEDSFASAGVRLPAAGGGYLRQLPVGLLARAFRERGECGEAGMFYVHPWEIDPDQPRLDLPWLTRTRHYRGLARTEGRLERLLAAFPFTSVARRFGLDQSGARPPAWSAPALA